MESTSKQILGSIPEFFFIYDVDNQEIIHTSNPFFAFTDSDTYNMLHRMRHIFQESDYTRFDKVFNEISKGNFRQDIELKAFVDGRQKSFNLQTFPIMDGEGPARVAGHVVDVTNKVNIIKNLKQESENLENVLHILIHDLRGPLANIINLVSIWEQYDKSSNPSKISSIPATIEKIARNSLHFTESIIELIEIQSGKISVDLVRIELQPFLQSIAQPYKNDALECDISFEFSAPSSPIIVPIDPFRLKLAIQNLLSNAFKFTPQGGHIKLVLSDKASHAEICVKDSGIGIPDEMQFHIFDKFNKARRKGIRGEKTIGLGLSIVKQIVEMHNGQVSLNSSDGNGSCFTIKIPK